MEILKLFPQGSPGREFPFCQRAVSRQLSPEKIVSELLDSKQHSYPTGSRWIRLKVKAVTSSTVLPECLCICVCIMLTMNILFNLGATSSKTTSGTNKLDTHIRICLYQSFQDFK